MPIAQLKRFMISQNYAGRISKVEMIGARIK